MSHDKLGIIPAKPGDLATMKVVLSHGWLRHLNFGGAEGQVLNK